MAKIRSIVAFADCGVTSHQALYRQVGTSVARHGAQLICIGRKGQWPQALVESAFAGGGAVKVMVGPSPSALALPQGVAVETFASDREAARAGVQAAQTVLGLPGGIDTAASLYAAWTEAGGAASGRPVGLLNRDRAYEVVRGFIVDVAAHGRGNVETLIQFADNFDELWTRLTRLA